MRIFSLLAGILLLGCAATTEIIATQDSLPAPDALPPAVLLVVAISPDDELRRRYEQVFIEQLQRAGLEGHGSHQYIPSTSGMTMQALHQAMQDRAPAFARILHLQLAALVPQRFLGPQDYAGDVAPAHGKVGTLDVTLNAPASDGGAVVPVQYLVDIQASLYEGSSRRLLWSGTTQTREANSLEAIAKSQARALLEAFQERGYVRGQH